MKPYEEMSDAELSEAFAVQIAKWTFEVVTDTSYRFYNYELGKYVTGGIWWSDEQGHYVTDHDGEPDYPGFATSADAVLPWLSKPFTHAKNWKVNINFSCLSEMHYVTIYDGLLAEEYPSAYLGVAPSLARAACLALLKAKKSETAT